MRANTEASDAITDRERERAKAPQAYDLIDRAVILLSMGVNDEKEGWLGHTWARLSAYLCSRRDPEPEEVQMLDWILGGMEKAQVENDAEAHFVAAMARNIR
jgi:hypothetical protein